MSSTKHDFVELSLDSPYASGSDTFNATIKKKYRKGQDSGGNPQYYDLEADVGSGTLTNFSVQIFEKGGQRVSTNIIASVATNGTTSDNRQKYTFTVAKDGATHLEGYGNDNDGTLAAGQVHADNIVDSFPEGSTVKVAWDRGGLKRVEDLLTASVAAADNKYVQFQLFAPTQNASVGDGRAYFKVPAGYNLHNLSAVTASVITAGTTGTLDIQIHNVTQAADMLTTKLTIDSAETTSETAATAAVIDTANDDVATNDLIRVDIDAVHTTPSQGLILALTFNNPS